LLLEAVACKQVYISPHQSPPTGYLVIEGTVNSGHGNSTLKISRTTPLNNLDSIVSEIAAQVNLEGEDNSSYLFSENPAGHYNATDLNLNTSIKYRLHIKTVSGKEYLSDYVGVNNNPPIDSISREIDSNGMKLNINTHDPQNNTRYYQWEYAETWEFRSIDSASLKYNITSGANGDIYEVVKRNPFDPPIFRCWHTNLSQLLVLGSSTRLSQDSISMPLVNIPLASWEISVLYSLGVKQYSWTKEGYQFLEEMKKNTEQTGSIFDAQPSQFSSNFHCLSDPTEPVIGFMNICPVQEKRIFISNSDVPNWGYVDDCFEFIIENDTQLSKNAPGTLPIAVFRTMGIPNSTDIIILNFFAAPAACVDCTLRGSNVKPDFWP